MSKCNNCYHNKVCIDGANYKNAENCRQYVPAADLQEVKHGQWAGTVCTNCGESTSFYYDCDYCPNCGARMDGEES